MKTNSISIKLIILAIFAAISLQSYAELQPVTKKTTWYFGSAPKDENGNPVTEDENNIIWCSKSENLVQDDILKENANLSLSLEKGKSFNTDPIPNQLDFLYDKNGYYVFKFVSLRSGRLIIRTKSKDSGAKDNNGTKTIELNIGQTKKELTFTSEKNVTIPNVLNELIEISSETEISFSATSNIGWYSITWEPVSPKFRIELEPSTITMCNKEVAQVKAKFYNAKEEVITNDDSGTALSVDFSFDPQNILNGWISDGAFKFNALNSVSNATATLTAKFPEGKTIIVDGVDVSKTTAKATINITSSPTFTPFTISAASVTMDQNAAYDLSKDFLPSNDGSYSYKSNSASLTVDGNIINCSSSGTYPDAIDVTWTPAGDKFDVKSIEDLTAWVWHDVKWYDAFLTDYKYIYVKPTNPLPSEMRLYIVYYDENGKEIVEREDFYQGATEMYLHIHPDKKVQRIYMQSPVALTSKIDFDYALLSKSEYLPATKKVTVNVNAAIVKENLTISLSPQSFYLNPNSSTDAKFTSKDIKIKYFDNYGNEITSPTGITAADLKLNLSNSNVTATTKDINTITVTSTKNTGVCDLSVSFDGNSTYNSAASNTSSISVVNPSGLKISADPSTLLLKMNGGAQTITYTFIDEKSGKYYTPSLSDIAVAKEAGGIITVIELEGPSTVSEGKISVNVTPQQFGSRKVILDFNGNALYNAKKVTVNVIVEDNNSQYIGAALTEGMKGTLDDNGKTTLHWKFGSSLGEDVWHIEFQGKAGKEDVNKADKNYWFASKPLALGEPKESEGAIDNLKMTRLTQTDSKIGGDAYTEYNGMVGGYGTEMGGRYLTPITGTYIRVEPLYDGVVTLRFRHNGGVDGASVDGEATSQNWDINPEDNEWSKDLKNFRFARRPIFVMDENGMIMRRSTKNWANLDKFMEDNRTDVNGKKSYQAVNPDFTNSDYQIDGTWAFISKYESKVNESFHFIKKRYLEYFKDITVTSGAVYDNVINKLGKNYDYDYSVNAFDFVRNVVYRKEEFDKLEAIFSDANKTSQKDGSIQKLWYSESDEHVMHRASVDDANHEFGDDLGETKFFSKYGYEVLSATHMKLSFPVKAGRTYFVGANKSKIALCTIEFQQTGQDSEVVKPSGAEYFLLDEDAYATPDWLTNPANYGLKSNTNKNETGNNLKYTVRDGESVINVVVKRKFTPGNWHPIVLPFSVSETMLKEKFGEHVQVIYLDGDLKMLSSFNNYTSRDRDLFSGSDEEWNGSSIKDSAIKDGSVTFTRHYYQMLYANCPAFLYVDPKDNVEYDRDLGDGYVRFDRVTYSQPQFRNDMSLLLPFSIDREIGSGYEMVAKYCATGASTISNDMYFLSNDEARATIYHAIPYKNPAMKGMRVWIEPKAKTSAHAPLRYVGFNTFYGEELDMDNSTSGIRDIVMDDVKAEMYADGNVYDLMGQIVSTGSTDGLQPGIYIYRGRKIYIR